MRLLSIPLLALFTVVVVLLLVSSLRRLLGITLSPVRTLIAALIVFFSASPIVRAVAGTAISSRHPRVFPVLWFLLLGLRSQSSLA